MERCIKICHKSSDEDRVYTDVQELLLSDHSKYELCQTQ